MNRMHPQQARSIANFLEISRLHFGLPSRRRISRSPYRRFRRAVLRLALIAGSVGSLFGGAAFAEHDLKIARHPQVSPAPGAVTLAKAPSRSSLEAMP